MKRCWVGLWLGLAFVVLGSSMAAAQVSSISGVYAYNSTFSKWVKKVGTQWYVESSMLSNSNVAGIAVKAGWNTIETSDGVYNWAEFDELIAQAAGANKAVTLNVVAGYQAPSWLFTEGAKGFNFIWYEFWGPAVCSVVTIPVPWDTVFLQKWTAFVQAFGARYNSNPTVTGVKISGINSVDEETSLPYNVNQQITGKTSCTTYDDVTDWQAAGYTRTLVESSWLQIAAAYQSAFPLKTLVATMDQGGFPPIDSNGVIFTPAKAPWNQDAQATLDIIADGVADYPTQFALQNDGLLTWGPVWKTEVSYANQITTGYQTISALGLNLPLALNLASGANAGYLELYYADLNNSLLQAAIAAILGLL